MNNKELHIIDVAPLCYIPLSQSPIVSYTSDKALQRGAIVEVNYGKRTIKGLVLESESVKNNKLSLKKINDFELKPIKNVLRADSVISERQLAMAHQIYSLSLSPLGVCIDEIMPEFAYDLNTSNKNIDVVQSKTKEPKSPAPNYSTISNLFIQPNLSHIKILEKEINKILKKRKNVLYIMPDFRLCEIVEKELKQLNPLLYTSKTSKKQKIKIWENLNSVNANLFIGTKSIAFLPLEDIGLIIIEDHLNESYKNLHKKPSYNSIDFFIFLAKIHNSEIIFCGTNPILIESKRLNDQFTIKSTKMIDMVAELKNRNFTPLSSSSLDVIDSTISQKKSVLFLCPRRGFAPAIGCNVCGKIIKCPKCNSFLKLTTIPHDHIACFKCKAEYSSQKCPLCNSNSSIKPLGNGVEQVFDIVKWHASKLNPNFKCQLILKDSSKYKLETSMGIFVSTQHILSSHSLTKFDFTVIIDAELFMTSPEYDTLEKAFRLYYLAQLATKEGLFFQVYNQDLEIPSINKPDYIDNESLARRIARLPPFSDLIEISYAGNDAVKIKNQSYTDFNRLKYSLDGLLEKSLFIDPPHISADKDPKHKYCYKFSIRGDWPDLKLRNKTLSSLNPNSKITISTKWT